MKHYRVEDRSGHVFGIYKGATAEEAIEAMYRDEEYPHERSSVRAIDVGALTLDVTIVLRVYEEGPGDADYVINRVLDDGVFQETINDWLTDGRRRVKVIDAAVKP